MTVFIKKGDAPMNTRQAVKRGLRHFETELAAYQRETGLLDGDPGYIAWAEGWKADNLVNAANNLFNHQLAGYRAALARLAQFRLVDGKPEEIRYEPSGGLDEDGAEILVEVVIASIDPLPAEIERVDETGDKTIIPNPPVAQDEGERGAAQAVIDATPQEVIAFHEASA